jgi:hypothetical protein
VATESILNADQVHNRQHCDCYHESINANPHVATSLRTHDKRASTSSASAAIREWSRLPITDTHPLIAANNPTADLAHLRGNQWEEAARRRAHEFNMLPKEHKEKKVSEFLQSNAPANIGLEASQPNRHSGLVQDYATPVAPGCGTPAVSNEHQLAPQQTQQAYRYQHQQPGAQTDRGHGAQSFAHHPSYSNATSAFPDPNAMYAWSIQKPPEKK